MEMTMSDDERLQVSTSDWKEKTHFVKEHFCMKFCIFWIRVYNSKSIEFPL